MIVIEPTRRKLLGAGMIAVTGPVVPAALSDATGA